MYTKTPVPRAAAIHDLSGFGRSSLTVVIPILSTMGIQVVPLPTAILSTHTGGFTGYHYHDLTPELPGIIDHWKQLKIDFDAVYSGFLGSPQQVDIVIDFIRFFSREHQLVVVDPVLGDDGISYGPIGPEMIDRMKKLIGFADIITPNITEAAFLLDKPYSPSITKKEMKTWVRELSDQGPATVIVTSVPASEKTTSVIAYNRTDGRFWEVQCGYVPAFYPGTGDIFTSVITGSLLQGDNLPLALDRAVQFVSMAIRASFGHNIPNREGVLLERVLNNLRAPVTSSSYEILS
ncbi:MAG: pyridoxamine kinase [Spirochaetales bacterium]|nr:pyridoxamine kinase [Spirochaetales bacterium]